MTQNPIAANQALFKLEYPQSLGVFQTYADAQKAVDHLADQNFPVKNLAIVGTDLRLMERVTGRRTWGTVLGQGVMSGLSTGFIVAIFMMILFPTQNFLGQLLTALVIGVAIGLLFAVLGYVVSRGQRDFTSITQTVATKYELLCEHKVAAQARELLAQAPGARASLFDPQHQPQAGWQQQGWQNQQQAWQGQQQGWPNPQQQGWPNQPQPGWQPQAWPQPQSEPGQQPHPGQQARQQQRPPSGQQPAAESEAQPEPGPAPKPSDADPDDAFRRPSSQSSPPRDER